MNDDPDAVLDFDFLLITLKDDDGNVVNDKVSNVLPSSSDSSEVSVSSGGQDIVIADLDIKIKQKPASPNGSKIEGIAKNRLEPVFPSSASSVEILLDSNHK